MKFAIINPTEEVIAVYGDHVDAHAAREALRELDAGVTYSLLPIMTLDEWMATHTDFRGLTRGTPSVLYLDVSHGTVLSPVYLIDSWDAYQTGTGKQYRDYNYIVSDKDINECSICDTDGDINRDTGYICSECAEKYAE